MPAFARLRVAAGGGTVPAIGIPTLQDLMRHTAGLAYGYLGGGPAGRALAADGFLGEDLPLSAFVDRLAALPLEYQPGTVWHYSHATEVLGRVVEIATGRSLGDALRDLVLDPLAMTDTGFLLPERDRFRVAQPLPQPPGARPRFFDPCLPRRHESAGGGLVSTAADYARFCRMLLGRGTLDGARLLSPAAVALMTADHLGWEMGRGRLVPSGAGIRLRPGLRGADRSRRSAVPGHARGLLLERCRRHVLLDRPRARPLRRAVDAILLGGTARALPGARTRHGLRGRGLTGGAARHPHGTQPCEDRHTSV